MKGRDQEEDDEGKTKRRTMKGRDQEEDNDGKRRRGGR